MELTATERRVLGVMIEKGLTQPDSYPLTLNAIRVGANQLSNRDPVMSLLDDQVLEALDALRRQGLATVTIRESGRAERWGHNAAQVFALNEKELAVLAELLLRGPQTEGELRPRAARMRPIESAVELADILQKLASREAPLVLGMAKEPGRRGIRYRHTLYPEGETPAEPAAGTAPTVPLERGGLAQRIEALEAACAGLREELAQLRREVDELKSA